MNHLRVSFAYQKEKYNKGATEYMNTEKTVTTY